MLQKQFLKNYSIYFGGAMLVAVLNYLFYPILARLLPVTTFGEVQAVVSLFTEFSVVISALSIMVLHIIASPGDVKQKARTIGELRKFIRIGALVFAILIALASPWIARFFHFTSAVPFFALAILIFVATLPLFGNAYLQGKLKYFKTSVSSSIGSIGRIVGAVVLVLLGFDVGGVIIGIAFAQLLVWIYVLNQTAKVAEFAPVPETDFAALEKPDILREFRYAGLVFVSNISVVILCTADILSVKHYFDPTTAGVYAGISAIANIGYFALSPLATVILPSVAGDVAARRQALKTALIVFFGLAIPGLLLSYLFRGLIVAVLFGARYEALSGLLPLATLLTVSAAFAQVFCSYFLALRRAALAIVMPLGLIAAFVLVALRHGSIPAILTDLITGAFVAIIGLLILYAQDYLSHHSNP